MTLSRRYFLLGLLGIPAGLAACTGDPANRNLLASPTPVPSGGTFSFAIQADPHLDEQSDPALFRKTLQSIRKAQPKFLIDLGDDFMIDKIQNPTDASMRARYELFKSYYAELGSDVPLHFAMGNHDGELGWDPLNTHTLREEYFPDQTFPLNYYSLSYGDALCVVIDPYSYTMSKPGKDGWNWSLGREQYDWLTKTLQSSTASRKFIFTHQLVGGDSQGRGGVEWAHLYEWGGKNLDGTAGFAQHRAGWPKPIHQLFVDTKVTAVFKGHDHLYCQQSLDGITYQTLPQPSHPGTALNNDAANYGYKTGTLKGGSGFLLVTLDAQNVEVSFIDPNGTPVTKYSIA
jgi:hypothetical protein